jgi:plastocyanin
MAGRGLWVGVSAALLAVALALVVGSSQAATVHVELKNFAFNPQNITVDVGDTVVWTNNESHDHDVTFEAGFGSGAGALQRNETFNHTFDDAGVFAYRCTLHSNPDFLTGMVGNVTVRAPIPAADHYVEMKNAQFTPAQLQVEPGDTVTWINNDTFGHDVLFEDGFGSGAAGAIAAGATYTHTFTENGTFRYRCQVHSAGFTGGMVGTIVVGDGGQEPPPPAPGFLPGFEAPMLVLSILGVALVAARGPWRRS